MASSTASMGFVRLKVGYWNVGWTETTNVSQQRFHGIGNQIGEVIKAMEETNCNIVFCTNTQEAPENLVNINLIGNDKEKRLGSAEYKSNDEIYNVFWVRDKSGKRRLPGGICVIWKQLAEPDNIKGNVVNVKTIETVGKHKNSGKKKDFDITKHRIFTVEVFTHLGKMVFICCYGIPECDPKDRDDIKKDKDKDAENFYEELERVIKKAKKREHATLVAVLGDLNVQIPLEYIKKMAKEMNWPEDKINTFGNSGCRDKRKNRFSKLCENQRLAIASVLFPTCSTYEKEPTSVGLNNHFAMGWVNPKQNDAWIEDDDFEENDTAGLKTLDPNGKGICTNVRVTDKKLPEAKENYHFLYVASLDLRNATDRLADQMADEIADQMADEMADRMADRMPDEMADRMADRMADQMADEIADQMADEMADQLDEEITGQSDQ